MKVSPVRPLLRTLKFGMPLALVAPLLLGSPLKAWGKQQLKGHLRPEWASLRPEKAVPAGQKMALTIGLPLRNQAELDSLLQRLYDPRSPSYRRFLKPGQFAELFGPAEEDYQTVVEFARSKNLSVTGTVPNRMLVDVEGSVEDIQKAFHLHLNYYQRLDGSLFWAPDAEPWVDTDVPLLHIGGLDNYILPSPCVRKAVPAAPKPRHGRGILSDAGLGPSGEYAGSDFKDAYVPGVALSGTGQSVALVEFDGFYQSDITQYESQYGLPNVPVQAILLDSVTGTENNTLECPLDIDMAIAMAPGLSQVYVYEGAITSDVLNRIATDDLSSQISCSWIFTATATDQQALTQYAAQGQSFFTSSGDSGAYTPGQLSGRIQEQPNITVVGGTVLTTDVNGMYVSEMAWEDSSGGFSEAVTLPTYQQGVNMSSNGGSMVTRNVPDVSMVSSGVFIYAFDGAEEQEVWGTSISAPLWAAFTALANQQAAANSMPALGFLNPALYSIGLGPRYAVDFHDITTGNSFNQDYFAVQFFAVPGYDLVTGWGSPAGQALIDDLVGCPDCVPYTPGPFYRNNHPLLLGPNISKGGQPVVLFLDAAPQSCDWKIYTMAGELVKHMTFNGSVPNYWTPNGVATGLYLVNITVHYADGSMTEQTFKVVVYH